MTRIRKFALAALVIIPVGIGASACTPQQVAQHAPRHRARPAVCAPGVVTVAPDAATPCNLSGGTNTLSTVWVGDMGDAALADAQQYADDHGCGPVYVTPTGARADLCDF